MPLNPDLAAYLQLVESGRRSGKALPMHQLQPEEARRQFDQSSALMDPGADEPAFIESRTFTARDGHRVEARLYRPPELDASQLSGAVLYLHGGGYVVGSLDSHDALCWNLAQECGLPVLSVGYRLAPQWRFPTAFNDAQDAWQWLALNARELGIDAERMAVVGDSVGGSLATVLASSLAGQEELPRPCLQVLIYPVTDASRISASVERYGVGHLLEKDTLEWFYQQYQNDPADRLDPRFSPLLGEVSAHVAPALLIVAECDPLHDEAVAYARHLEAGGVQVQLEVFEGMSHDFLRMGSIVDEADVARERIVLALAERLG
ncbi:MULTISPECIES: alpha/beta hydrolase [unclassified Pseudomonas]|jgi:acetyl esterase|uniref:alpha/beta hydrolase n=1 Tax=unclassified Pseudomonas TaxID=196821 RepID=UPI00096B909E|nr:MULTISPECIES: alpha/beta hydrolase [unclassified Pseudomonas]MDY0831250.1 alpha/beta hydrolase [Pseudomonas sp. SED1]OLY76120.1 lipase [Pseudomonas sp. ATCC PTA-122608]